MTAQVVKLHEYTIDQMVNEIHKNFATEREADNRADRARIRAGQLLLTLRKRIEDGEAGDVKWWDWYRANIARSRRDGAKCMALARSDDPDAAAEAERTANRDAKTRQRGRADVSPKSGSTAGLVARALKLVGEMDSKQRRRFFAALRRDYGC